MGSLIGDENYSGGLMGLLRGNLVLVLVSSKGSSANMCFHI